MKGNSLRISVSRWNSMEVDVTAHRLTHQVAGKPPARRPGRYGLVRLGWPQFWLLAGVLGGMLALVALVFFIALVSR